jgi:hypothetical protein
LADASAAVTVVPIPANFASSPERANTTRFASRTSSSRVVSPARCMSPIVSSASCDATSPAFAPPIPSAIA